MITTPATVKIQCVDLPSGKHLIAQLLFIEDRVWRPCSLPSSIVSKQENGRFIVRIAFEVEMNTPCWIQIDSKRHDYLRAFDDGAALYQCEVEHADVLTTEQSFQHDDYRLKLYHILEPTQSLPFSSVRNFAPVVGTMKVHANYTKPTLSTSPTWR